MNKPKPTIQELEALLKEDDTPCIVNPDGSVTVVGADSIHEGGARGEGAIDHRSTEGRPTPGPWEYLQDAFRPVYRVRNLGTPRLVVCQVTTGADASLIVRAVNAHDDMLAALIAASHALKSYVNHNGSPVLAAEVAAVADAAVAKAEGRS